MLALDIINLSKVYKNGTKALDGVNLKVKKGEFLALLGKNGAGKTTFVEILSSLTEKTSGSIKVCGKDISKKSNEVKDLVGIVPQEINLAIFESIWQILITQAGYYGIVKNIAANRAEKLLKELKLWDVKDRKVMTLSGGMKRRLMIARALIHNPQIIFFDEPTAGVDIEIRQNVWNIMQDLNKQGKTIILTTHYFEEAEKLCKTLAIIKNGIFIIYDDIKNILSKCNKQKYLIRLSKSFSGNIKEDIFQTEKLNDNEIEVLLDNNHSISELVNHIEKVYGRISDIKPKNNRLEEYFLSI